MVDTWKAIPGYEGRYLISTSGQIRRASGKERKVQVNPRWGYRTIQLCKNGSSKPHRVARLVAQTFIPNPENKEQVNHKNGIKTDDNVENLEWVTRSENQLHSFRIGLNSAKGEKNRKAKLKSADILTIRRCAKEGMQQKHIATIFNVDPSLISHIMRGLIWSHVK